MFWRRPQGTTVPLREHLEALQAVRDEAHQAALDGVQRSTDKFETENRAWRDAANEWRGAMADRERDFLTRREFYSIIGAVIGVAGVVVALIVALR